MKLLKYLKIETTCIYNILVIYIQNKIVVNRVEKYTNIYEIRKISK